MSDPTKPLALDVPDPFAAPAASGPPLDVPDPFAAAPAAPVAPVASAPASLGERAKHAASVLAEVTPGAVVQRLGKGFARSGLGDAIARGTTDTVASALHSAGDFVDQTIQEHSPFKALAEINARHNPKDKGAQALAEGMQDPLGVKAVADNALGVHKEINKDRQVAQERVGGRPTLAQLKEHPGDAVEQAAAYYGNMGAESAPAMALAMATRNPELASNVMAATSGTQEYTDLRSQGVDRGTAALAGVANAAAEKVGEDVSMPFVMGEEKHALLAGAEAAAAEGKHALAAELMGQAEKAGKNALGKAVLAEGAQEFPTQIMQQQEQDMATGQHTSVQDQLLGGLDAAVVGGLMGAGGHGVSVLADQGRPKGPLERTADAARGHAVQYSDAAQAAHAQAAAAAAFPNDHPDVLMANLRTKAEDPAATPAERQQALTELQALLEVQGRMLPAPGGFTVAPDGTTTRGAPNPEVQIAPGARPPGPFGPGLDQQAPGPKPQLSYDPRTTPLAGDIQTTSGKPFATEVGASRHLKTAFGGRGQLTQVDGGWVIRAPMPAEASATSDANAGSPAADAAGPAAPAPTPAGSPPSVPSSAADQSPAAQTAEPTAGSDSAAAAPSVDSTAPDGPQTKAPASPDTGAAAPDTAATPPSTAPTSPASAPDAGASQTRPHPAPEGTASAAGEGAKAAASDTAPGATAAESATSVAPSQPAPVEPPAHPGTTATSAPAAAAVEGAPVPDAPAQPSAPATAPVAPPASAAQAASAEGSPAAGEAAAKAAAIEAAAHTAATSDKNDLAPPTAAQKDAGNYQKGHVRVAGLDISIENPAGSKRNEAWPALAHHYGYIKGTIGKDKDHVDVFLTEHAHDETRPVFVVDQRVAGKFDEHKVVLGASTPAEARKAYLANYSKDFHQVVEGDVRRGISGITQMTHAEFERWVRDPNHTVRPATEAASLFAAGRNVTPESTHPANFPPTTDFNVAGESAAIVAKNTALEAVAQHTTLAWPTKGWRGAPSAQVSVAQDGAEFRFANQFQTNGSGFGRSFNDRHTYPTPEAARRAGLEDLQARIPTKVEGVEKQHIARIRTWIKAELDKLPPSSPPTAGNKAAADQAADQPTNAGKPETATLKADVGPFRAHQTVIIEPYAGGAGYVQAVKPASNRKAGVTFVDVAELAKALGREVPPKPATPAETKQAQKDAGTAAKVAARAAEQDLALALTESGPIMAAALAGESTPALLQVAGKEWLDAEVAKAKTAGDTARVAALEAARGVLADPDFAPNFFKKAQRLAKEREKAANRDPAVYAAGLSEAFTAAALDAAQLDPFKVGWDHALAGRTKSSLPQDEAVQTATAAGYEAARGWIGKGPGRAWYEGKAGKKLANTGVDLRRWFDAQRAKLDEAAGDAKKLWGQLSRATVRADLFQITPTDPTATPGVTRYLEHARDSTKTFGDYFRTRVNQGERFMSGGAGTNRYIAWMSDKGRRSGSLDARALEFLGKLLGEDANYRFVEDRDAPAEQWAVSRDYLNREIRKPPLKELSEEEIKGELKKIALDYISGVQYLRETLQGASSAADAVERAGGLVTAKLHGVIDAAHSLANTPHTAVASIVSTDEKPLAAKPTTATPLRRPKLDAIVRTGLQPARKGDVTPQQLKETFGLGDVGFGGYVAAKQDQDHVNYAYDALHDLANLLRLPAKAMGLLVAGTKEALHLTIGALGQGRHAAHYADNQPGPNGSVRVINLTNTSGDGTVAHEWGHALDYALSRTDAGRKAIRWLKTLLITQPLSIDGLKARLDDFGPWGGSSYITRTPRDNMDLQARAAIDYVTSERGRPTNFKREADGLGADYWGNDKEPLARAFEAFVYDTLLDRRAQNNYLVNDWVAEDKVTKQAGYRGTPYPQGAERTRFALAFQALAGALTFDEKAGISVDLEAFEKALPKDPNDVPADNTRAHTELVMELTGYAYRNARKGERRAATEARAAAYQQRQAELAAQQLAALEAAAPVVAAPPTSSEALSDADLESLFDAAEAELREAQQETPDAAAPGSAAQTGTVDLSTVTAAPAAAPARKPAATTTARASELAAEAAKLGVKGLGETFAGLHELFGGNALKSFPGAIDEATYAKAKPHFDAALIAFKDAGKSLKDLFKFLIQNFGPGIRPYAIAFAKEHNLGAALTESHDAASTQSTDAPGASRDAGQGTAAAGTAESIGPAAERARAPGGSDRGGLPDAGAGSATDAGARQDEAHGGSERPDAGEPGAAQSGDRAESGVRPSARHGLKQGDKAPNYSAPPGAIERTGSWRETAERNVQIVELANELERTGRNPTLAEQALLARYTGWGASELRNPMFPGKTAGNALRPETAATAFRPLVERLAAATSPAEQATILRSTQYAHYTSEPVVRGIWDAVTRMGFGGGKILEPGMGVGLFPILAPADVMGQSHYTGIELDHLTAKIAGQLLPQEAVIRGDFTKQGLPRDYFDLAIGNPPFASVTVTNDPEYKKQRLLLHDYFFAKTIDRVRPGGLLVFVTSKGTMDKATDTARSYLAERADLLGAIRLPQTAFLANAGTEVVTDVLFLQKRAPGAAAGGEKWLGLANVSAGKVDVLVNEYFAAHPEMVLGEHALAGSMYRANEYTVTPRAGQDIAAGFAAAAQRLPANVYTVATPAQRDQQLREDAVERDFNPAIRKEGAVYLDDKGVLRTVAAGSGVPLANAVKLNAREVDWLKAYVPVRDAVKQAQHDQLTDGDWEKSLKALNKAYAGFVKKHGQILDFTRSERERVNEDGEPATEVTYRYKNKRLLRLDAESALVAMLEKQTEDDKIVPGSFLTGRSLKAPAAPKIETIPDALAVSLDQLGRLDLPHVAALAKTSEADVVAALGESIYQHPGGGWEMADAYLSGDVVTKLEEAEVAARGDRRFERNVKALAAVQPKALTAADIKIALGMPWIPLEHVNAFASHINASTFKFVADGNLWIADQKGQYGREAGATFATSDRSPSELLDAILNAREIRITRTDADKKTYLDKEATAAANEAASKIREEFRTWIWTDAERAHQLLELYNRRFNNLAPRLFNGEHLTLPGLSLRYKLYPHQLRAVWRQIQAGNTYIAHAVGAGKTLEMIVGGMEQRRLGLIRKPMYAVPNHMLQQFSNEFMDAYPAANIIVADEQNFDPENRARFAAMTALNNPDAVIITHSALAKLATTPETRQAALDEFLDDLEAALDAVDKNDRINRRRLEQQKETLERRIEGKAGGEKDKTLSFEQLGVDFLYVDEAHEFRKLDFVTNRSATKGIDPNGSARATDLYVKARWLETQRPGRSLVMASGTPVTNTMAELYTIERYMAGTYLRQVGLHHFDAWAAQHGEVVQSYEPNAAGRYEKVERFAKFVNLPEQMARVRSFMDVITMSRLGDLVKRPKLIGGVPANEVVPRSGLLAEYMAGPLSARIEISKKWRPSPSEKGNPDPIINIITDGRLAAIDMRFVRPGLVDDPSSKLNLMVKNLIATYQATSDRSYVGLDDKPDPAKGAAQIIFSAVGFGEGVARSRGFDMRAYIVKRLTEAGIPASQLAFMSDYTTHAKKEAMFKELRQGTKRFLFGSPKNMGTGLNVQKRLYELHYLAPPWYPADVEQPHGRILRQGNQNEDVSIRWYATKGTYDSSQWAMVARKGRFIEQALEGDTSVREIEDISEVNQYEMAAALAAGDERVIDLAKGRGEVERLARLEMAHKQAQSDLRWQRTTLDGRVTHFTGALARMASTIEAEHLPRAYADLTLTLGDKTYRYNDGLGEHLHAAIITALERWSPGEKDTETLTLGKAFGRFPVELTRAARTVGFAGEKTQIRTGELVVKVGEMEFPLELNDHTEIQLEDWQSQPPAGLTMRLLNLVNRPYSDRTKFEGSLAASRAELARVQAKIGAPFEYAQQLAQATSEVATLERELAAETTAEDAAKASGGAMGTMLRRTDSGQFAGKPLDVAAVGAQVERLSASMQGLASAGFRVRMAPTFADLPMKAQVDARNQGAKPHQVRGVFDRGELWVVAGNVSSAAEVEETVFHEAYGHAGMRLLFGRDTHVVLSDFARRLGGLAGILKYAAANDVKLHDYVVGIEKLDAPQELKLGALMDELLAHIAERGEPTLRQKALEVLGRIKDWLRAHGFATLAQYDAADIARLLQRSREAVKGLPKQGPRASTLVRVHTAARGAVAGDPTAFQVAPDAGVDLDALLAEHGQPVTSGVDANRRWGNGERLFAVHEQSEGEATEVTSHAMLESYTPDQLLALPRGLATQLGLPERGQFRTVGQTQTLPFREFFGNSKVVDAQGAPRVVYHGTAEEFWQFDKGHLAGATGHMSAPLGFFFAEDLAKAERYAAKAANGVPADEVLMDVYLSIQKPKAMTTAQLLEIDSKEEAAALRASLQKQGFDGIHLTDIGQWIAFEPNQIKSASYNNGNFDTRDPDIRFSRIPTQEATSRLRALQANLRDENSVWERVKSMTVEDLRPQWLGLLTLSHLAELARSLPMVRTYEGVVEQMGADRIELMGRVVKVADAWSEFQARDQVSNAKMVNVMHDATIAGADPDKAFVPGRFSASDFGPAVDITPREANLRIRELESMLARTENLERQHAIEARITGVREQLRQETQRRAAYPDLVARFVDLPAEAKTIYRTVRKAYEDMSEETLNALVTRIMKMEAGEDVRIALADRMREQFESARLQGPYFPLARFGDFWISALDADGEKAFFMYETNREWKQGRAQLRQQGYTIEKAGRKISQARQVDGASGGFIANVEQILEAAGVDNDTRDEVYQLYLRTLPDLSQRKHFIHRKAVEGFSDDALRAFGGNMFHGAHQVARLKHTQDLSNLLVDMQKAIDGQNASDPDEAQRSAAIYNEMLKRHEWVLNPRDSKTVSKIGALGFIYYLGATPAAAITNLTQTLVTAMPVIGARYGFGATNKALLAATKLVGKHNIQGTLENALAGDERLAYQAWLKNGLITTTLTHNLAALSETDSTQFNRTAHKALEVTSYLFHHTEMFNRQVTALAAYRLARRGARGVPALGHADAVEYATQATKEAHFDYSNANRARFMQGGAAKVLLMFRQYSLNMSWYLLRNAQQSFAGLTPQDRAEARKKLVGTLGMTGLFAGALGLPMLSVLFGMLNALHSLFDDDDEPWDAETEFRNWAAETFGHFGGTLLTEGAVNAVAGVDLSSRVSLNNLWLREADRELEGMDKYDYYLEQIAGPVGGIVGNAFKAMQLTEQGHLERGVETLLPKALKDALKAWRYSQEGVNTLRGDPLVPDAGLHDVLGQLMGFTPAEVAQRYDANNAAKRFEQAVVAQHGALLDGFALALHMDDAQALTAALRKIAKWNSVHPEWVIDDKAIKLSIEARARYSLQSEDGIYLNPRLAQKARAQGAFAGE